MSGAVATLAAGLTMHEAIGTSLLVIALKSVAGFAGHATHVTNRKASAGMGGFYRGRGAGAGPSPPRARVGQKLIM